MRVFSGIPSRWCSWRRGIGLGGAVRRTVRTTPPNALVLGSAASHWNLFGVRRTNYLNDATLSSGTFMRRKMI